MKTISDVCILLLFVIILNWTVHIKSTGQLICILILVSGTSFTKNSFTVELNETQQCRPVHVSQFLKPGKRLEPDSEEWRDLQHLHDQKHLLKFDSDVARRCRSCNRLVELK